MTATASLEDYIKQFKQDYKKYLTNDTSSITSSIDTDELLSDMSSETSSIVSRPVPKSSIKSISSLKKRSKKSRVNPPSHMKPLRSTPLKMIQEEEDELAESKYKLSDYLPSQQIDINEYLPRARAAKNQKVSEILASLDVESENLSVLSSVDTEALLQSSDEDEEIIETKIKKDFPRKDWKYRENEGTYGAKTNKASDRGVDLNYYEKEKGREFIGNEKNGKGKIANFKDSPGLNVNNGGNLPLAGAGMDTRTNLFSSGRNANLSIDNTAVFNVIPKKMKTETFSINVANVRPQSKRQEILKPSEVFNSFRQPQTQLKNLKVCTCILSGSIYSHFKTCTPVTILADFTVKPVAVKKQASLLQSVIKIQRCFRNYRIKKTRKNTIKKPQPMLYIDNGAKTLSNAYKELEMLKSLASDRSSEISIDENEIDTSSVDTESLLNSSFSSILSRNY